MSDDTEDVTGPLIDPADDAAIAALLADLPAVDMPDDVVARVTAALADEVPLSGAVPPWAVGGATNVSVLPSAKERERRTNPRGARILSGAAALVLVLGAVVLGTHVFGANGTAENSGGGTAGGAPTANGADAGAPNATLLSASDATYTTADLAPKVEGLVASATSANAPVTSWSDQEKSAPTASPEMSVEAPTTDELVTRPLNLLAICVSKLGGAPGEVPIAVDAGTWKPATGTPESVAVVVLQGPTPARVDVFVVRPGCADPKVVDDSYLVYYASVAR